MATFGEDANISTPSNADIKTGLTARGFLTANLLNWVLNLLHDVYETGIYLVTTLKPKSSTIEILDSNDDLVATIDDQSVEFSSTSVVGAYDFVARPNSTNKLRYQYGKTSSEYPIFVYELGGPGWDFAGDASDTLQSLNISGFKYFSTDHGENECFIEQALTLPHNITDDASSTMKITEASITLSFVYSLSTVAGATFVVGYYTTGGLFQQVLSKQGNLPNAPATASLTITIDSSLPANMDIKTRRWAVRVTMQTGSSSTLVFRVVRCHLKIREGQVKGG